MILIGLKTQVAVKQKQQLEALSRRLKLSQAKLVRRALVNLFKEEKRKELEAAQKKGPVEL